MVTKIGCLALIFIPSERSKILMSDLQVPHCIVEDFLVDSTFTVSRCRSQNKREGITPMFADTGINSRLPLPAGYCLNQEMDLSKNHVM